MKRLGKDKLGETTYANATTSVYCNTCANVRSVLIAKKFRGEVIVNVATDP